jgi:class 3 adenylate cyclase
VSSHEYVRVNHSEGDSYFCQLRLLLEDLCCDLCRFELVNQEGIAPESVQIDREYYLGLPDAFADIRVQAAGHAPYFVEVKHGYPATNLLRSLRRKYTADSRALHDASKVVLVIDAEKRPDWKKLEAELPHCFRSNLKLEVWDDQRLLALLRSQFSVEVESITGENLLDISHAIEQAKGFHAFGGTSLGEYEDDPLRSELLWHFGFWQLRRLREAFHRGPREVLTPALYRGVAVLLADLCSFSAYVRDTRDDDLIRNILTSFYSKSRYQILNNGGMLYQFVGDEVVALFGIPDHRAGFVQNALESAKALLDIGTSISNRWQRHIDRVQTSRGVHIGMAIGDLQIVSLRPFSRTRMGAIGDAINVAARLMSAAGPNEIVVSNAFYNELDEDAQGAFQETEPVEARNVGRIKAWRLAWHQHSSGSPGSVA